LKWFTTPRAYSCLEPDTIQTTPYIAEDADDYHA
jgi:hypothetical protein